uniref:Uncharacterized protein n=1 Tax=Plectus sambesii TaxID=2011161 RepID=A0A914WYW9_9BILA
MDIKWTLLKLPPHPLSINFTAKQGSTAIQSIQGPPATGNEKHGNVLAILIWQADTRPDQSIVQGIADDLPGLQRPIMQGLPKQVIKQHGPDPNRSDPSYPLYIITCFLSIEIIEHFIEVLLNQVLPAGCKPLLCLIVPSKVAYNISTSEDKCAPFHAYPRALQVSDPIK